MGREIEIKIPVTDEQFDKILSVISGASEISGVEVCGELEHFLKSDCYFSRYDTREESKAAGEPQVIRIRSEAEFSERSGNDTPTKSYFCIKRKTIENGIELNREDETFIEKPEVIRDLLLLSSVF